MTNPLDYQPPREKRPLAVPAGVIVGGLLGIAMTPVAFIIGMAAALADNQGDRTIPVVFPSLALLPLMGLSPSAVGRICALTLMVCQYPAECALIGLLIQRKRLVLAWMVPIAHLIVGIAVA